MYCKTLKIYTVYHKYQAKAILITSVICTGPWKAAKIMSFFDVIPKEIDALSKNGFVLERDMGKLASYLQMKCFFDGCH